MHIDITAEVIATQLGFASTSGSLEQVERIINNTPGFDKFSKHIISLNDALKHMNSYIAPSNTVDFFKIKAAEDNSPEINEEFHQAVRHWSEKYKVNVEAVPGKPTYYIRGIQA